MLQPGALYGNPALLGPGVVRWGLASLKGVLELDNSLGKATALEQDPHLCFLSSNPPQSVGWNLLWIWGNWV